MATITMTAAGRVALALAALALAGCDATQPQAGPRAGTQRGLPPSTNLHAATGLPPGAVYSVARTAQGWRVLYHGGAASQQSVAARLCASVGRGVAGVRAEQVAAAAQLPGARKIAVTCA